MTTTTTTDRNEAKRRRRLCEERPHARATVHHSSIMTCITSSLPSVANTPFSTRPIIDWDLILVMEPVILLGAIIGTYLNKILEGKIIIVMLVLLLSVIAHMTLKKARRMHHAEELYIKRIMWAKQKRMNAQTHVSSPIYPGSFDNNKLAEAGE